VTRHLPPHRSRPRHHATTAGHIKPPPSPSAEEGQGGSGGGGGGGGGAQDAAAFKELMDDAGDALGALPAPVRAFVVTLQEDK
jgi:hypothetical protein